MGESVGSACKLHAVLCGRLQESSAEMPAGLAGRLLKPAPSIATCHFTEKPSQETLAGLQPPVCVYDAQLFQQAPASYSGRQCVFKTPPVVVKGSFNVIRQAGIRTGQHLQVAFPTAVYLQ